MMILHESINLFARLLLAHLLADFVLQSSRMVGEKRKASWGSGWLLLHAVIAGTMAYLLSAIWEAWLLIGVGTAASHWLIDVVKIRLDSDLSLRGFLIDQTAHLGVIGGIVWLLAEPGTLQNLINSVKWESLLVVATGIVLLMKPTSVVIAKTFRRWKSLFADHEDHLPNAGEWIGYTERLLILIFMLAGEYFAIGFLITAKSILRFRDQKGQQRMTEYILLGTLLSFSCAMVVGIVIKWLLAL